MKKLIIASAITAAFASHTAVAEEAAAAAPEATPEHVVAYNLGATTDYVFRGISQSRNSPALSGGVDYTHSPTGLYAGTWASTISWINDSTPAGTVGNTPFELDLYGGKRGEIGAGVSYDVGAIYYYYANNKLTGFDANTLEVYGQVGYGPVYLKVNYGVTDVINTGASGSYYVDGGANIPVMEGVTLNLHAGYFSFKDNSAADYMDWKVGVTKDFGGLTGALAATGTDAKSVWNLGQQGYLGDTKFIATVTKTF
jgi:uncharacterized protein (TIGR02001 family)